MGLIQQRVKNQIQQHKKNVIVKREQGTTVYSSMMSTQTQNFKVQIGKTSFYPTQQKQQEQNVTEYPVENVSTLSDGPRNSMSLDNSKSPGLRKSIKLLRNQETEEDQTPISKCESRKILKLKPNERKTKLFNI